ncbi:hypothetical protein [Kineothrix sedimenti]|uniref:Uncharacterized protein n=1 Tax=Kineothrix sedimenti TaxID=3123317 RepID=A0ABZ3ETH4_9FIRM
MIWIEIDEKIFERGSHVEIKKRNKDGGFVILEVPKSKEVKTIAINE